MSQLRENVPPLVEVFATFNIDHDWIIILPKRKLNLESRGIWLQNTPYFYSPRQWLCIFLLRNRLSFISSHTAVFYFPSDNVSYLPQTTVVSFFLLGQKLFLYSFLDIGCFLFWPDKRIFLFLSKQQRFYYISPNNGCFLFSSR